MESWWQLSLVFLDRLGIKCSIVLLPLLGITWVFGVLAFDQATVVFLYLFAIFNSLQVFSFWIDVSKIQVRFLSYSVWWGRPWLKKCFFFFLRCTVNNSWSRSQLFICMPLTVSLSHGVDWLASSLYGACFSAMIDWFPTTVIGISTFIQSYIRMQTSQ